jgi:hypothetical protein
MGFLSIFNKDNKYLEQLYKDARTDKDILQEENKKLQQEIKDSLIIIGDLKKDIAIKDMQLNFIDNNKKKNQELTKLELKIIEKSKLKSVVTINDLVKATGLKLSSLGTYRSNIKAKGYELEIN